MQSDDTVDDPSIILFLIIAGIIVVWLLGTCIKCLVLYIGQECVATNLPTPHTCPCTSIKTWVQDDMYKNTTCIICLDDFQDQDQIRLLSCQHIFHSPCIQEWFNKCHHQLEPPYCPICREPDCFTACRGTTTFHIVNM